MSSASGKSAQFLLDLEEMVIKALIREMADPPSLSEAEDIARVVVGDVALRWGGIQIYLPQDALRRRRMLYEEFDGNNHAELARKYGISLQAVYRYIKRERTQRLKRCQGKLFEDPNDEQ